MGHQRRHKSRLHHRYNTSFRSTLRPTSPLLIRCLESCRSWTRPPSSLPPGILSHRQLRHWLLRRVRFDRWHGRRRIRHRRIQPHPILELRQHAACGVFCCHCMASHASCDGVMTNATHGSTLPVDAYLIRSHLVAVWPARRSFWTEEMHAW